MLGNQGRDRLFGGKGPDTLDGGVSDDMLKGQAGNDALDGGPGTDTCYQDQGTGPKTICELPPAPVVAPPPDAIDPTNVLVIAYTDLNGNHTPDAGDVMIAQVVDSDPGGIPSVGDTIEMGMYPTKLDPVWPADFKRWGTAEHRTPSRGP